VGSAVYIESGPLAGVEGVVTNTDKVYRLIVSVNLLKRSVAVEIDRDWVRPVTGLTVSGMSSKGVRRIA
jgi:transcription antitermination factor NusG